LHLRRPLHLRRRKGTVTRVEGGCGGKTGVGGKYDGLGQGVCGWVVVPVRIVSASADVCIIMGICGVRGGVGTKADSEFACVGHTSTESV
jgi:hypothetical protein